MNELLRYDSAKLQTIGTVVLFCIKSAFIPKQNHVLIKLLEPVLLSVRARTLERGSDKIRVICISRKCSFLN